MSCNALVHKYRPFGYIPVGILQELFVVPILNEEVELRLDEVP